LSEAEATGSQAARRAKACRLQSAEGGCSIRTPTDPVRERTDLTDWVFVKKLELWWPTTPEQAIALVMLFTT